ncbi:MAG: hypothetical protein EBT89_04745 [Opitutaceae bacterium]|nr:hypothetical protein [Opitutaceae bacterium]
MTSRHSRFLSMALLLVVGCVGCQSPEPIARPLIARFFLEVRPGEAGLPLTLPVSGVTITVNPKPVIVENDIINAEHAQVDLGPCLLLQFTPAAGRDLYRLAVTQHGQRLVLVLNDAPVGARRLEPAMAAAGVLIFIETPATDLDAQVARLKRTAAAIAAAARATP